MADRPITGFFALLSPEQLAAALAHSDDDNHGSDEFRRDAHNAHPGENV